MTLTEFKTIKKGDVIFYLNNLGMAGIFKYQYLGVFKDHRTKENKHLFISEYFLSTVCLIEGKEKSSRGLEDIFLTELDVKKEKDKRKSMLDKQLDYFERMEQIKLENAMDNKPFEDINPSY